MAWPENGKPGIQGAGQGMPDMAFLIYGVPDIWHFQEAAIWGFPGHTDRVQ